MKPTRPKNSTGVVVPSGGTSTLVLPTSKEDVYWTIGKVQTIIPVTSRTLYQWRKQNILPAIMIGGTVMYSSKMVRDIFEHKFQQLQPTSDE